MTPLKIRLLGSPEVIFDEQPLSFFTQKALALLIYLVVEGGMHSRERLMTLLWSERPSEKANATLRTTLSRLRRSLKPAGDYLISDGGRVGYDFAKPNNIDLVRLATADQPGITPDDLGIILTLDRGEFLEGFTLSDAPGFDTWATVQREACQRQLEMIYDRYSQHLLNTRENMAAVETAARWVARAPFSEQAYRRLMAAQALSGQRPAALQTYEQLRATLQQELGLEPSRETAVLADNIGRGRVDEDRGGPLPAVDVSSAENRGRRLRLPLVGRSEEHSQLVAAFRQTNRGAQLVALIGAAGSGKTRLVSAFQEWAKLDSPEIEFWEGRAFETGGRLAYQPIVEALRPRLEAVNAPEDLLEDVWLAELSQLMPELRARYPDLSPPLTGDPHFIRARLFEALALLGSALATGRTAVLVLDDMQWADADTLDLVHYLARRWSEMGAPILLMLTIRQEAYAADAALREWLTGVGRDAPITRLLLDSLNGSAVEQLVNRLAGGGLSDTAISAFATWLWAETRGLPFFIEALLQMLVEQSVLPVTGEGQPLYDFAAALDHIRSVAQVPLPPGVREVIHTRLVQHSKKANAQLLAAAVLGRTCTFERLCQVADLSESDALEALEALLDGRLMTERPSDRRPYSLAHDYIREVVYSESREARRRVFHRRALLGLEASGAPAAECAFHALAALLDEPAFRYSVAAGGESFAAYAAQEALAHFDTAREVAWRMEARGEPLDMEALGRLYRHRGQALELIQDDEAAQANYEEMRETAVKRGSKKLELASLINQSNLHGQYSGVFNPLKSKELAQEALVLAGELGDKAAEAGALCALTVAEFFSAGDNRQIMAYGQGTLALARELGLKNLVGRILNVLCWPLVGEKQLEQAREVLSEAQAIWRELGNLPQLGEASRFMLIVHFIAGDHRRILAEAPELDELGASTGSRLDRLNALLWLANVHVRQGRFGRALDYLKELGALSAAIGYSNEEQGHMVGRFDLYLAAGALEEAERWADRLYAQRETIMPTFIEYYLTGVARVKIACGKLNEGQAMLDGLLGTLQADAPVSHIITSVAVTYAELRLARGQPEAPFAGFEERARPYREAGFISLLADEYWLRGRAAMAMGEYDTARVALMDARVAAETQEERTILWKILVTSSELERACGHEAEADRLREQARVVVSDIAAHAGDLRGAFLDQPAVVQLLDQT